MFQVAAANVNEAARNYMHSLIQSIHFLVQLNNGSIEEIKGLLNQILDQRPSRATAWRGTQIHSPTDGGSQGVGGTTRPIDPLLYLFNLFSSRKYSCSASIS
jgi:hypothetical protein